MQTGMLLLSHASSDKQDSTRSESWQPQLAPYVHHEWHTDTIYENDQVKAQKMGLQFSHTFSYGVVHFGDIPAERVTRVVAHDQTILYQRPSDVISHAPAIQHDFRASVDQLLDPDQQSKRSSITSGVM